MRRRHLESVSAALYGRCFASFVSSRSLAVRGSWGTAPSVFWFLLYEQKERHGGEPYRLCTLQNPRPAEGAYKLSPAGQACQPSPSGDSATPIGDYKLVPPAGVNEALTTIYFFFIISESPGQNIPIE